MYIHVHVDNDGFAGPSSIKNTGLISGSVEELDFSWSSIVHHLQSEFAHTCKIVYSIQYKTFLRERIKFSRQTVVQYYKCTWQLLTGLSRALKKYVIKVKEAYLKHKLCTLYTYMNHSENNIKLYRMC